MADPVAADAQRPQVNEPRTQTYGDAPIFKLLDELEQACVRFGYARRDAPEAAPRYAQQSANLRVQVVALIREIEAEAAKRGTPRSLSDSEPPPLVPPGIDPATGMRYSLGDDPMQPQPALSSVPGHSPHDDWWCECGQPLAGDGRHAEPPDPTEADRLVFRALEGVGDYRYESGAEPEREATPPPTVKRAEGTSFGEAGATPFGKAGDPLTPVLLELAERYHSQHSEVGTPCHCDLCYELAGIRARLSSQSPVGAERTPTATSGE